PISVYHHSSIPKSFIRSTRTREVYALEGEFPSIQCSISDIETSKNSDRISKFPPSFAIALLRTNTNSSLVRCPSKMFFEQISQYPRVPGPTQPLINSFLHDKHIIFLGAIIQPIRVISKSYDIAIMQ